MAKLLLGISGRVELGETLSLAAYNTTTGTSSTSGFTLQWQHFSGGTWSNVGTVNSTSYAIPSGSVATGRAYRVVATPTNAGDEASQSLATAAVTADKANARAPTLADVAGTSTITEGAAPTLIDSAVTFNDQDNGNYGGGTLLVANSNALAAGGDGRDVLAVRHQGTGSGQIGYNAATRDVTYQGTVIGRVDAAANGDGQDLLVAFNTSANKTAVDRLIENLQWSNADDSPTAGRLLTIRVTDPTAGSVQSVVTAKVTEVADAPLFSGVSAFQVNENQAAVGTIAAADPDREAAAPQGITYSLVGGTGSTDNAAFAIDAASGALRFLVTPDFEGAHGPNYAVRVRASDSNGGTAERALAVQVLNVNEAPVTLALTSTAQEDGPAVAIPAVFTDPDAGDTHTVTLDSSQTQGSVTLNGNTFSYSAGSAFNALAQGQTAADSFSYTVTDAAGLSSTQVATVTVTGVNDPAYIWGQWSAGVQEDTNVSAGKLYTSGTLYAGDPDAGQNFLFTAQTGVVGSAGLGVFAISEGGLWNYQADNAHPAIQSLGANDTLTDTITVQSIDGSASQLLRVTITGTADAPVISGQASGAVTEAGSLDDGTPAPGSPVAGGALAVTDADLGEQFVWRGSAQGTYGDLTVNAGTGAWQYTLDNGRAQSLGEGQLVNESFTVTVTDSDGLTATQAINIAVNGTNDVPWMAAGYGNTSIKEFAGGLHLVDDLYLGDSVRMTMGADGSMYVAGAVSMGPTGFAGAVVLKLNADGSTDTSYGNAGRVQLTEHSQVPNALAVDAAGRLLVTAQVTGTGGVGTNPDFAVYRYNPDGSPDTTFGANGRTSAEFAGSYDYAEQVLLTPDGKVLVAGDVIDVPGTSTFNRGIIRFNEDGSVDTSFGNNGRWAFTAAPAPSDNYQVALDAAGRLLLWGTEEAQNFDQTLHVYRYLADGQADLSFGSGGHLSYDIGYTSYPQELVALPTGGLVAGWLNYDYVTGAQRIALVAFDADGSLDAGFGAQGVVQTNYTGTYSGFGLAATADGQIVVGTYHQDPIVGIPHGIAARFNADGSADTSFGNGGVATADFGQSPLVVSDVLLSSDGDTVTLAGQRGGYMGSGELGLAQFDDQGHAVYEFGDGFGLDEIGGFFNATDPDTGAILTWSGSADGVYGTFEAGPSNSWTYRLDNERAATNALEEGQQAFETFMMTAADQFGAFVAQPVTIMVIGSYDQPVF